MASIADRFMAEFVTLVADEVIRRLEQGGSSVPPSRTRSGGGSTNAEQLLTPQEAADILRLKKNTLAVWRMTPGAGPEFVKRGRFVFYTPEAIQAYIERNTIGGKDWA